MLLFHFTTRGFEPNQREKLMGRKMPSLSPSGEQDRCGYDFVIMQLTETKERMRRQVQRKTNVCSNAGVIADFLAGRTGLSKTNGLYYPSLV